MWARTSRSKEIIHVPVEPSVTFRWFWWSLYWCCQSRLSGLSALRKQLRIKMKETEREGKQANTYWMPLPNVTLSLYVCVCVRVCVCVCVCVCVWERECVLINEQGVHAVSLVNVSDWEWPLRREEGQMHYIERETKREREETEQYRRERKKSKKWLWLWLKFLCQLARARHWTAIFVPFTKCGDN